MTTYEYLLKLPAGQETHQVKCKQCAKFFIQKAYLEKHYANRHADKDFAADYKGYVWVPEEQKASEKVPEQKLDSQQSQEELFNRIKNEFATQLGANLKKMEREIELLKKSTTNVEQMEMKRNEEFKSLA